MTEYAVCAKCRESFEVALPETVRKPCPKCGSTQRDFSRSLSSAISHQEHVVAVLRRGDAVFGFTESDREEFSRHGWSVSDETIELRLTGLPPQNEEDADAACIRFVDHLVLTGFEAQYVGRGEQDEDGIAIVQGKEYGLQVVRALADAGFWRQLAKTRIIHERALSPKQAALSLLEAINHKANHIPRNGRDKLVLILDAYRLPALAIAPVVRIFRDFHAAEVADLGFPAAYVVGPIPDMVWLLANGATWPAAA